MGKKENVIDMLVDYPINIKKAISHYNNERGDKPKMTMEALGMEALDGEGWSDDYKTTLISRWNIGQWIDRCKVRHCVRISRITGYPLCELLENYND